MKKKCVITGIGIVSCYGSDKQAYYEALLEGKSGIVPVDLGIKGLENLFGGAVKDFDPQDYMDRKQARRVDPAIAYAIGASRHAIDDSHLDLDALDKSRVGVLIGTGIGGMTSGCKNINNAYVKNFSRVSPFLIPYLITNMPGACVSIEYGFTGPNYSISTACATSNYSLLSAKKHIESGECDVMLSGGVEAAMNEASFGGFLALHALSRSFQHPEKASRPFDKNRNGFVMGEGSAVFILESEEHAKKRGAKIYATLSGGAMNSDAHHMTNPLACGSQVAKCMNMALEDAGVSPEDVNYINTHATSTVAGDLCEIRAIKNVFGKNKVIPKINNTKSLIGHALGAAGGLELVAVLMAMQKSKLHPTINLDDPEEELEGLDLCTSGAQDLEVNHAISNSFGFGGHNSVLVVSK